MLEKAGITAKFIANIEIIYDKFGVEESFGQANVQECLKCSKSKATNIMNAMKTASIIGKVVGLGAGKYRFINF